MTYKVVNAYNRLEIAPGAIPTPLLVQEGYEKTVEAYFVPVSIEQGYGGVPGVWYLRDDAHGYIGPEYKMVKVVSAK